MSQKEANDIVPSSEVFFWSQKIWEDIDELSKQRVKIDERLESKLRDIHHRYHLPDIACTYRKTNDTHMSDEGHQNHDRTIHMNLVLDNNKEKKMKTKAFIISKKNSTNHQQDAKIPVGHTRTKKGETTRQWSNSSSSDPVTKKSGRVSWPTRYMSSIHRHFNELFESSSISELDQEPKNYKEREKERENETETFDYHASLNNKDRVVDSCSHMHKSSSNAIDTQELHGIDHHAVKKKPIDTAVKTSTTTNRSQISNHRLDCLSKNRFQSTEEENQSQMTVSSQNRDDDMTEWGNRSNQQHQKRITCVEDAMSIARVVLCKADNLLNKTT